MNNEIEALNRNNTWTICDMPVDRKPIGCKCVFKVMYKASGETESLVVKMGTVRSLISIAVSRRWPLYKLDVNNAFLYSDLIEYVYMTLPQGYDNVDKSKVCKLNNSLYGLKQAPRHWNAKLTTALVKHGFMQRKFDYSSWVASISLFTLEPLLKHDVLVMPQLGDKIMANKENLMIVRLQRMCISCLQEMLCGSTCFATNSRKFNYIWRQSWRAYGRIIVSITMSFFVAKTLPLGSNNFRQQAISHRNARVHSTIDFCYTLGVVCCHLLQSNKKKKMYFGLDGVSYLHIFFKILLMKVVIIRTLAGELIRVAAMAEDPLSSTSYIRGNHTPTVVAAMAGISYRRRGM
nr:ribonuclease H-like domain-containing protein [Tanacetum cinerariifolium]